jgi:DUF1016 N-terminal domain
VGRAVNALMTTTYWRIGERIFEQEQRGGERLGYGERIVERLAQDLSARFGRGFSRANVFQMRQFYLTYRAKIQTASGQFDVPFPLSWSHYVRLLTVTDNAARDYYEHEALRGGWSVVKCRTIGKPRVRLRRRLATRGHSEDRTHEAWPGVIFCRATVSGIQR